jgi:(S)-2-hydroxyglutarate dehydrogenase
MDTLMSKNQTDFLIIGGGVIGVSVGRRLKALYPEMAVALLEKEADIGFHASSRNRGVLHAGFYYAPDSLKAKLTRDGNYAMREYCKRSQIQVNACGKLVVAKDAGNLQGLDIET